MTPLLKDLAFICALIGFGTKAGIVPMHIWLPYAHPEAPSNVSALMSGVMIKIAIFMLIRVFFDFLAQVRHGGVMLCLPLARYPPSLEYSMRSWNPTSRECLHLAV